MTPITCPAQRARYLATWRRRRDLARAQHAIASVVKACEAIAAGDIAGALVISTTASVESSIMAAQVPER